MVYLILIISLAIILIGAEFFTNAIEWVGKKLNLSEGAVGSVLAAVGTALPEAMIPVMAILFGGSAAAIDIGIGAILGAPFMLATLAMFVTGLAALQFRKKKEKPAVMFCDSNMPRRDLHYFLAFYSMALLAAFIPIHAVKIAIALIMVGGYVFYVKQTMARGESCGEMELKPLHFQRKKDDPNLAVIWAQVFAALGGIVLGAHLFVGAITEVSIAWGVPAFVLSLIIAPIATELPEKFNSVVWVLQGKDTLAMGNITGAMVFQSSVITAVGVAMTPWQLSSLALVSGVLALLAAVGILFSIRKRSKLSPKILVANGALYVLFVVIVVLSGGAL